MTVVALLRGVNVGGRTSLPMQRLQQLLADLGFEAPVTVLQSGNALFDARRTTAARLEAVLERETRLRLSLPVDVFVRTALEWQRIVDANPFTPEAASAPSRLVLTCLRQAPSPDAVRALQRGVVGREAVRADGRQLYIYYPDGIGRSTLTGAVIERTLGTRGTARNWNTVLKVAALLRSRASAH